MQKRKKEHRLFTDFIWTTVLMMCGCFGLVYMGFALDVLISCLRNDVIHLSVSLSSEHVAITMLILSTGIVIYSGISTYLSSQIGVHLLRAERTPETEIRMSRIYKTFVLGVEVLIFALFIVLSNSTTTGMTCLDLLHEQPCITFIVPFVLLLCGVYLIIRACRMFF